MENEKVINESLVNGQVSLLGDPAAGTVKYKTTYLYGYQKASDMKRKCFNVFDSGQVSVFKEIVSVIIGSTEYFGSALTAVDLISMLSTVDQKNHARKIYEAVDKYIDLLALGRYTTIILKEKYVWEYQGKNKQYWKIAPEFLEASVAF